MNELFVQSDRIEEVADGILKMPFLTEQGSNVVLNACKQIGGWSEHTRHYPTQDIHLFKELPDLDKILKARLERVIFPKVSSHFMIDTEYDMFALFAIKYAMDGQTKLPIHHDQSFISGSVKLNDDYEGGLLSFPKQIYDNRHVSVGDIILWPGDITHPHLCTDLLTNEKYALTIWTKTCGKWPTQP